MNRRFIRVVLKSLNKKIFLLGMILSVVGIIMGLYLPQFVGRLLDRTYLSNLLMRPGLLIGFIVFFVFVYVIQALSSYFIGQSGSRSLNHLQKIIYHSLLKTSIPELDRYQSGELASRLTNDISVVLNFITVILPNFLMDILKLGGSIYFLWVVSPFLTTISLLTIPFLALIMVPMNQKLETNYTAYQEGLGDISSRISHKFTHIRLVKSFQGEQFEQNKMAKAFEQLAFSFEKIIQWSVIQQALVSSLMTSFIVVMLLIAGMEVAKGTMTMATLTTFVLYIMQLIEPATDIASSLNELTEFNVVSNRLMELLELGAEEKIDTTMMIEDTSIYLKDVHFSYQKAPVLRGVSVCIPAGSHIAIVGPSGSGKTTIFSLLMKFYRDYQGEISIGENSLHSISIEQVRNLISYISQENTFFHGTVRENLLYGKNEAVSEERIDFVLKELGLSKFVDELEHGLDTHISESGIGLSEGQKQRFSIARALLLDHSIYLLDEVTASLDNVTERIISKAIDCLTAGKTRLTIAHRLHTVRDADAILVLDKNGQVSDFGSHRQLLKRSPIYNDFLKELPKVS